MLVGALGDGDAAEQQFRADVAAQGLRLGQAGPHRLVFRGRTDEDAEHSVRVGHLQPSPQLRLGVLADAPVDNRRAVPLAEVFRVVGGGVHGRQVWKRPLRRIAVALVVDVVERQTVQVEEVQPCQRGRGDLPYPLGGGAQTRRRDAEQQDAAFGVGVGHQRPESRAVSVVDHVAEATSPFTRQQANAAL